MAIEIRGYNTPQAYEEGIWKLRSYALWEKSRNGPVLTIQQPVVLTIEKPEERVLFDTERNANPFFHLMETVWMLAGACDVGWLLQYNKRYSQYADGGTIHGAYGHRWRYGFGVDQIKIVVDRLKRDPETRQAVIGMWNPMLDTIEGYHDYPCNTHIYFRNVNGSLNMTVCNRSNDYFWGMMGANVVHMTILQEIIASACGLTLGKYQVFTNNLHAYTQMKGFEELMKPLPANDPYSRHNGVLPWQIMINNLDNFLRQCELILVGRWNEVDDPWLLNVVEPMAIAWQYHKDGNDNDAVSYLERHTESKLDWRKAGIEWLTRKMSSSVTSTAPSPLTTAEQSGTSEDQKESNGTNTSPPVGRTL